MKSEVIIPAGSRPRHTEEFKKEAVRLVRESAYPVARDLEIPDNVLYRWIAQHRQAEAHGITRASQRAKIDPSGMIRFFERLSEKDEGRIEWLSTHPMSTARADRLKTELAALPKKLPEPFTFGWKQVQASLGTTP